MLTKEGANAFLKTLEEPPPHAVFILATTEPEKLPVTILSRCQRYAFRRIAIPVMIERMREIARAESIAIDDAALSAIAYRADGGLRDALTMLEQAAAFADGAITTQTIELAFGASGRNYAETLLGQLIARDANAVLKTIDEASDAGADMQVLMRGLIAEFRNLLVARIDPALLARDLAAEDAQTATERSRDLPQGLVVRALRLLSDGLATARSSGNPRLELETALLRYIFAPEDPTYDALNARVSVLESGALHSAPVSSPAPAPQPQPQPEPKPQPAPAPQPRPASKPQPAAPASGPVTIQKIKAAWESIRTKVEGEKQSLRGELRRAMLISLEDHVLAIQVPSAYSAEILKESAPLIRSAIQEALGADLQLRFEAGPAAAKTKSGSAPGTAARLQDGAGAFANAPGEDPDELFSYLNERIK